MSNRYSNYPSTLDALKTLPEYADMTVEYKQKVVRYEELLKKNTLTSTEKIELDALVNQLKDGMITSHDWNLVVGAIENTENYFKNTILTDIGNIVDNGETQIENAIISAKTEIDNKVVASTTDIDNKVANASTSINNTANDAKSYIDNSSQELVASVREGIQQIIDNGEIGVDYFTNRVVLSADSSNVKIGIQEYNNSTDFLMVYINGVYGVKGVHYNLGVDNFSIIPIGGAWIKGTELDFAVFKSTVVLLEKYDVGLFEDGSIRAEKLTTDVQSKIINAAVKDGTLQVGLNSEKISGVALSGLVQRNDYVASNGFARATGSVSYDITLNPAPTAYVDGMSFTFVPNKDNTANHKINVNNLGATTILKGDGSPVQEGEIKANIPVSVVRVGSNFFIRSGGSNVTIDDEPYSGNVKLTYYGVGGYNYSASTVPYGLSQGSVVVLNNEIHILGSSVSGSETNHYKWDGASWSLVSILPYQFYGSTAVVLNNEIHILGSSYYYSGAYQHSKKHYKWNGTAWTSVSTLPYDFYNGSCSAVVLNNEIHILGGISSPTNHYKWNGSAWTKASTLPYNFSRGNVVVLNNEIHILGGTSNTNHYKWNGSGWSSVSTLPYTIAGGNAVVYNEKIHLIGGQGTSGNFYIYKDNIWNQQSISSHSLYDFCTAIFNKKIHLLGSGYSVDRTKHTTIINSYTM